jgi:hypothetical protein
MIFLNNQTWQSNAIQQSENDKVLGSAVNYPFTGMYLARPPFAAALQEAVTVKIINRKCPIILTLRQK